MDVAVAVGGASVPDLSAGWLLQRDHCSTLSVVFCLRTCAMLGACVCAVEDHVYEHDAHAATT